MREIKTPDGILVRKPQFEFPLDFDPHWHPTKAEWSPLVNGASVILAYFEPCTFDAIRTATKYITGPALLTEAKAWISQEPPHCCHTARAYTASTNKLWTRKRGFAIQEP